MAAGGPRGQCRGCSVRLHEPKVEHADAPAAVKATSKAKKKLKLVEEQLDQGAVARALAFIADSRLHRFGRIGRTEFFLIRHLYLSEMIGGDAYEGDIHGGPDDFDWNQGWAGSTWTG